MKRKGIAIERNMPKINKILDMYESETGGLIGVRGRAITAIVALVERGGYTWEEISAATMEYAEEIKGWEKRYILKAQCFYRERIQGYLERIRKDGPRTAAGIIDDDEYEDICFDDVVAPVRKDGHMRECKNVLCGISFHSTHVEDKCPACGMSQISEYSHGDAYDGHLTPPAKNDRTKKRCIIWIPFDRNSMPPDGSYIARINISGRVDNPGYNKLRVLNGYCPDEIAAITTHYAIDPGID